MGAVLKRAHKWGFFGKPQTKVGLGRWDDLSGLLFPVSEGRHFVEGIKSGSLETIEEMVNRSREANDGYRICQWAWTHRMILEYYGINEISPEDGTRTRQDYIEVRRVWIVEIKKDAERKSEVGDVDREVFESFVGSLDYGVDFEN